MKQYLILLLLCLSHVVIGSPGLIVSSENMGLDQIGSRSASVINIDHAMPTPIQDVNVIADVVAPTGVSTVDLVYSQTEVDNSKTVVTMSPEAAIDFSPSTPAFDSSTALDTTKVGSNYTKILDYLTSVSGSVSSGKGPSSLVYFEFRIYNLTSASWQVQDQQGNPDGSITLSNTINFSFNGAIGGISLYVINQRNTGDTAATFDSLSLTSVRQYSATIPATGISTAVPYFIRGLTTEGVLFYSQNYTLYSNNRPTITAFNNPPTNLGGNNSWVANVTVTDSDGYDQINYVMLYYRLESQTLWSNQLLHLDRNTSMSSAIFTSGIDLAQFGDAEENIMYYVNVTDSVSGVEQVPVKSSVELVSIDTKGPQLSGSIDISADPLVNNATKLNSPIRLNMTFSDSHGIESAFINYRINDQELVTSNKLNNVTILSESDQVEDFYFDFDGFSTNTIISYSFETTDFWGNSYQTDLYYLYVDATGPIIAKFATSPIYPSNNTGATLVYTVDDSSGVTEQQFSYRRQSGSGSWTNATPTSIDYQNEVKSVENFTASGLPINILDDATTELNLTLQPTIAIDDVRFQMSFQHERPSDLRIYVEVGNTSVLIFDRGTGTTVDISLLNYFALSSLQGNVLTLVVEDLSPEFVGTIQTVKVMFIDYNVPIGYDYQVQIPPQSNDTTVDYFFYLVDGLGNNITTGIMQIYLDGTAPVISNHTTFSEALNLRGKNTLSMEVEVIEKGQVDTVEYYYRYNLTQQWQILPMVEGTHNLYQLEFNVSESRGTLFYQFRVFDKAGYEARTGVEQVEFINANAPEVTLVTKSGTVTDLGGKNFFHIEAVVKDDTGISEVLMTYSLNGGKNRTVKMVKAPDSNYFYDVSLDQADGRIELSITAFDIDNQNTTSQLYTLKYKNADIPLDFPLVPVLGGVLGLLGLFGIGLLVYRRIQSKDQIMTKTPL